MLCSKFKAQKYTRQTIKKMLRKVEQKKERKDENKIDKEIQDKKIDTYILYIKIHRQPF